MNLYDKLNVQKDATPEEIKKAYRKKAKQNHPDKSGGDAEEMQSINKAYAVLKDPDKRERYDKTGDENTVNNEKSALTQIICEITQMLIKSDPVDVKRAVSNLSEEWNRNYNAGMQKIKREKSELEKFKQRILHTPDNNIVGAFIDGKITSLDSQMYIIDKDFDIRQEAIAIFLNDYIFQEKQQEANAIYVNGMSIRFETSTSV